MLAIYIENKVEEKYKVIDFLNNIHYYNYDKDNLRCRSFFYIDDNGNSYISEKCPFVNDNFLYSSSNLPELLHNGLPKEIDEFIKYWSAYYCEFPNLVPNLNEKIKKTYGRIDINHEYYQYYLNKISYYYDCQYKPYNSIFCKPYEAFEGYNVICNNIEQIKALQRFFIDAGFVYANKYHYPRSYDFSHVFNRSTINMFRVNLNSFKFAYDTVLPSDLNNVSYYDFVKYYLNNYKEKFATSAIIKIYNEEEYDEVCNYLNQFISNPWFLDKYPVYDETVTGIIISKSNGICLTWDPLNDYVTVAEFINNNFGCKLLDKILCKNSKSISDESDKSEPIEAEIILKTTENNSITFQNEVNYESDSIWVNNVDNNLKINNKTNDKKDKDMNSTPTNKKSMSSTIIEKFKSQFLPVKDDNLRMTMDGHICAKIGDDYISINSDLELVSYPEEMCIDFPVYVISKQAKDVKVGDIIKTAKSYAVVTDKNNDKKSFKCISFSGYVTNKKEVKDFLLNTSLVKTVFNMFNSSDSSFNPMMLMLMGDGNMDMKDIMMMQMMSKGGNTSMNPMMLMLMSDKGNSSSMMEVMLMSQMMNGNTNMFNMFGSKEKETKTEE